METGWSHPVTLLCTGSLGVDEQHRSRGAIPNTFHIITLFERTPQGAAHGELLTYEYSRADGWTLARNRTYLPLDGKQQFGYISESEARNSEIQNLVNCSPRSGQFSELPDYQDLPATLRCLKQDDLNNLFDTHVKGLNGVLAGKYPDCVMVKWK